MHSTFCSECVRLGIIDRIRPKRKWTFLNLNNLVIHHVLVVKISCNIGNIVN